ncbi:MULTISPECIES: hypothetical protein [unclassified Tolypothrix]|nr:MULTISPECIES: hypothetical protein [unclassified Tolypothrix]EKF00038.1 hypothetical protein FDUTEX481_09245 [Tolypothrix sp. PCC 7601]MBE9085339.1 hypothetical protein [Tolypothrix sp. LEGE 11397]UYD36995.1 hypothetical protein HG267_15450 [Tolypothrix sp. PCC 7601]BAY93283.1 hypothetical protein NIES3275_53220 [Microchaete diplosiphon NIES-3275]
MGNAHILMKDEVMKDEADWVAPKMEEDKAAYVIAKFFLNQSYTLPAVANFKSLFFEYEIFY